MQRKFNVLKQFNSLVRALKHSITKKLLVVVFSFYLVLTFAVTVIQMDFEYQLSKEQTIVALKNIQAMTQDGLGQALWEFNASQVEAIMQGMYTNQFLVGVKLELTEQQSMPDFAKTAIGLVENSNQQLLFVDPDTYIERPYQSKFESLIPYKFNILHIDAYGKPQTIGVMHLYSSNAVVFDHVKESYLLLIINAIIKTVALWIIFLWAGHRYISRPLAQLNTATKSLAAGNWNIELAYKHKTRHSKTEINTLFDSFNEMTHKLFATQDKLESSRNRLNNIFDTMPSALIFIDQNYTILGWNKDIQQATGISPESAIGRSLFDVYAAFVDYTYLIEEAYTSNQQQQVKNAKLIVSDQDANKLFDIKVYPILNGDQTEAVIKIDDVSEEVKREANLAQVEKLASVGALIAGVAHEINNPLGAIMQGTQNVIRRLDPELEANQKVATELDLNLQLQHKYLEKREIITFLNNIHSAGERASSIVKNMLKFTRRSSTDMLKVNVLELINDGLQLASTDVVLQEKTDFKKISIVKDYYAPEVIIECMPMEIQQVILNLVKNAAQALEHKNGDKQITIRVCQLNQDKMQIIIADNGIGISSEIQDQIFQPFFTTKPIGQGTGLGLSVCRNIIVQKHHGDMVVESTTNVGTKFIITLPYIQEASTN